MSNNVEYKIVNDETVYTGTEKEYTEIAKLNPFRYRSYYYDEESKLYYLNSRYYDPETGRFINADDISYLDENSINGLNLFAYCNNNPVMNVDSTGHAWWHWLFSGVAVIASVAISIATFGTATPVLVGASIGALVSGTFDIGKQLLTTRTISDWNSVLYSALGGLTAGAIAGIPISGSGILSYMNTFATGSIGNLVGGIISGSVSNLKTAITAFTLGGISNVIARGVSDILSYAKAKNIYNQSSKAKSLSIQQLQGSSFNMGSSALKGSLRNSFKDYSISQIFKLINNAKFIFRNGVYSAIVSSLMGGWY